MDRLAKSMRRCSLIRATRARQAMLFPKCDAETCWPPQVARSRLWTFPRIQALVWATPTSSPHRQGIRGLNGILLGSQTGCRCRNVTRPTRAWLRLNREALAVEATRQPEALEAGLAGRQPTHSRPGRRSPATRLSDFPRKAGRILRRQLVPAELRLLLRVPELQYPAPVADCQRRVGRNGVRRGLPQPSVAPFDARTGDANARPGSKPAATAGMASGLNRLFEFLNIDEFRQTDMRFDLGKFRNRCPVAQIQVSGSRRDVRPNDLQVNASRTIGAGGFGSCDCEVCFAAELSRVPCSQRIAHRPVGMQAVGKSPHACTTVRAGEALESSRPSRIRDIETSALRNRIGPRSVFRTPPPCLQRRNSSWIG